MISLIAVVDESRGLSKNNQLLCHLPADLQHFKKITWGKPIIMGRKTYNSIGKALPGRFNIVISHHLKELNDATIAGSLMEAFQLAQKAEEVMVIGGAQIFEQCLPYAERVYLTIIHHQFSADTFFPVLDSSVWELKESAVRSKDDKNPYNMTFCCFKKVCYNGLD